MKNTILFSDYYNNWISLYKEGAVRNVTFKKYKLCLDWIKKLVPNLLISDLDKPTYQTLLNSYADLHERQTTLDFHHLLKASILDAVDEGLISIDPTRKAIIKGHKAKNKKDKFLNQFQLHELIQSFKLNEKPDEDWLLLLIAKTGLRFSEAIALTPKDFDFTHQTLKIDKTWNYKEKTGFSDTKNKSSNRKIRIDWMLVSQFSNLLKDMPNDKPIFINKNIYNSTINHRLAKRCKEAGVPVITVHGLRHTHASILLYAGVSIASVAKRLGHSNMSTTQKIYLHIIQELDDKDTDLVMRCISVLS